MNCPKCFTPAVESDSDTECLKIWTCPNPACNHVVDEAHLPVPPHLCSVCGDVMLQVGFEWNQTDLTIWLACDNCGRTGKDWTDILEPYGCGVCGDETLLVVNDCPLCEKHAAEINAGKSFREMMTVYNLESLMQPISTCDEDTQPIFVDEVDTLLLDDLTGEG